VYVSAEANAKLLAVGQDAAGRVGRRYSAKFISEKAGKKFVRVQGFIKKMPQIRKRMYTDIMSGRSEAYVLRLEDATAIRVGSLKDTKAVKQAFGLTTLQGKHVQVRGDKIFLDFTAKKGVHYHREFSDKTLARFLGDRKKAAGTTGLLFPDVQAAKLNGYLKEISGGPYSVKDFRTYHATRISYNKLKPFEGMPLSAVAKKNLVKEVSGEASRFLGNTPAICKSSYIDPMVWQLIGGI